MPPILNPNKMFSIILANNSFHALENREIASNLVRGGDIVSTMRLSMSFFRVALITLKLLNAVMSKG